jgi:hypothetical protein
MSNHISIFSMIKSDDRGYLSCQLFAYSSKSLPAIEIIGMGKRCKIIKEKIIYWLKKRKIRLPSKRYVICLETFHRINFEDEESIRWLELPCLILLLVLSDSIKLSNVEKCFCVGHLGLDGDYFFPSPQLNLEEIQQRHKDSTLLHIYGKDQLDLLEKTNKRVIDFEEMLEEIKKAQVTC